ncbi:MAG: sulfatase-like hydrolase/transferase [Draconibacterium sp.]
MKIRNEKRPETGILMFCVLLIGEGRLLNRTALRLGVLFFILLTFCDIVSAQQEPGLSAKKPNVLFIAVDDLRPEINCYGAKQMHTPNLDRLASDGIIFERAYCQQAVCAPSRNTVLTGLRPDALGIYDLQTFFRKKVPDVITLPQHFKNNGYHTEAMGKIYHTGHGNSDDRLSWSVPHWNQGTVLRRIEKIAHGDTTDLQSDFPKVNKVNLPWYCSPQPEENMTDAVIADHAVERLQQLANSDTAFWQ